MAVKHWYVNHAQPWFLLKLNCVTPPVAVSIGGVSRSGTDQGLHFHEVGKAIFAIFAAIA